MSKFYITTSIAYVNAAPHIGFALESVQADVLARYYRQKGDEVFFLTGTDEHGAKIARAAEEAGENPKEFTDKLSLKFKDLKKAFNLSWDNFIRTSDQKIHWPAAQEIWNRIIKEGDLEKKNYRGLYCVGCEAFITKKDLANGKCSVHQTTPEKIEEENWFFKLSKHEKDIEKLIESDELRVIPESRKNEILAFIREGLEDISFSRPSKDLSWGIPVPGDPTQTMYVWTDALTNYISGYGGIEAWKKRPADIHIIGKDILRFHAVIWPAMLLSVKLPLPKSIFVHGFIKVDGEKMSKSLGNIIDPFELVKKYGTDAVRYYLLREIPSTQDGDFSYEKFKERYNGDLANGLGNLIARVAAIGEKLENLEAADKEIFKYPPKYEKMFKDFELNKILEKIWEEIHELDKKINSEKPWAEKDQKVLKGYVAVYGDRINRIANLLEPFLPDASKKIKEQFQISKNKLVIKKIENLFPRL